jgi:hypothetical protein
MLIFNLGFSQELILPAFVDDITSCDIDLDGDTDIICICQILNYDEDSIFIFYNNGDGVFQETSYFYPNTNFVLCDCVNEDEFPDIVSRIGTNIYYIPNYGPQGLGEMVPIIELSGTLEVCKIIDVNLDNCNDIIYTHISDQYWGILKNNGNLAFSNEIIQTGSSTTMPAVGFITDDSLPDIVLTYSAFDRSSVYVNNGNFNFSEVVLEETFIGEAFVMNIDNQGTEDFAFVNYYTNTVPLYKFIGNDQFELISNYYAAGIYAINSFLVGDFNQDGFDDFAITRGDWWNSSDSLYIYFNDHNWSFNLNQTLYIGVQTLYKSRAADLNGDAFPDIFMKGCNGSNIIILLWNDGNGNFSFDNPVKITEISPLYCDFDIFPNPFVNNLTIQLNSNLPEKHSIFIRNIYGHIIKSFYVNKDESKNKNKIIWDGYDDNQKACSPGIYLVTIKSDSEQISKKVIKY